MRLSLLAFFVIAFSGFSLAQSDRDKGIGLFRQGSYGESTTTLEKVFTSEEADYATALYLGASYVKTVKEKKATDAFAKAQSLKKQKSPEVKYDKKIFLTHHPKPRFSDKAKGKESSGIIRLAVEFKEDGKLGFIFPFEASSATLIDEAIKTAGQIRFEPAKIDGKPVPVVMVIEYAFFR